MPSIVEPVETDAPGRRDEPEEGTALALSGGGYRAMLFHLGTLWRLHEAGMLQGLKRISSVSGGSITAGALALAWDRLDFNPASDTFRRLVVDRVRLLAGTTIDADAILGGILLPGSIADRVARVYREHLFGDATLQDLPDAPRFVINATNVQSGVLWRFSKPYMGDWKVGRVPNPRVSLAKAVAASSAFPPVLSPLEMELDADDFAPGTGDGLQTEPFTSSVYLTDGGVYDNMGLETVWKRYRTVLVSDAGARMPAEPRPHADWARHSRRVLDIIDNQVRSLRKRMVIAAFKEGRPGAYWSIATDYDGFPGRASILPVDAARARQLAEVPTRLKAMPAGLQERLINWGYAATDAALRSHVDPRLPPPRGLPYPASAP